LRDLRQRRAQRNKGEVVIQLGNWHSWENRSGVPTLMSYVMIGGEFAG